jgi:hypothetical protein
VSYFPPPQNYPPHRPTHVVRNRWLIAVGIVFAIAVLAALLSGGEASYSDSGYVDSSYSDSSYSESGGDSQFYGDGENSIVVTEDGVTIYSDDNGNSVSVGG